MQSEQKNEPAAAGRRLALVIPALNEEDAIGSTLERALAAREQVTAQTSVREMLVVFVNDGSTDRTQEIADRYDEVVKVRFEKNRGYGAAIQAGYAATDAELVGFMDADGTCDPGFCVQLVNRLDQADADIVLGARLTPQTKMPLVRRIGNRFFAGLIALISGKSLTDSASGMRIMKRSCLPYLAPQPSGLHFTPVMSCTALLDPRLKIEEVPMPYEERVGESKLRVVKDGIKFLSTILFTAACYKPVAMMAAMGVLFALAGGVAALLAWLVGAPPAMTAVLGGGFVFVLLQALFAGLLCRQANWSLLGPLKPPTAGQRLLHRLARPKKLVFAGVFFFVVALVVFLIALFVPAARLGLLWTAAGCVALSGWLALAGASIRVIWALAEKAKAGE
ncbi:MAG: Undecaprenyl-phosphate 4-deoxy-4-formamido-L-arabinose transferase [Planctomycetes bacterium ADurb.Bin126]|nr:MAG: Undecaprenyl-phosphate 4-deoxy-4-formamido-L-arabinose transferase [Planctomycetes bacterium ADurb.Bin126]HOD80733.1 glycosyltransferase family 2 protein [Phycisphaerae bacterium]HQL71727.1 glycosyltransferase family 2 protein [Phycisphaerae bacterium]